jgi:hypothetical protein
MFELNDIYGISYRCPKGVRATDCPLNQISHLTFKEKLSWIEKLDDDEKQAILKHHACCTKK